MKTTVNLNQLISTVLILLFCAMPASAKNAVNLGPDNLEFTLTTSKNDNSGLVNSGHAETLKLKIFQNGKPVTGLRPKAWLSLRRSEQVAGETACAAKIKSFTSGQLATRADLDLNSYAVITLNQDKTVTFINPQVSWSTSKLEGIVQLPGQGMDWALTKDGQWLYVTMPEISSVALIDTVNHRLVNTIATPAQSKPARITLAQDDQLLWVGLDGSPQIAVFARGEKPKVNLIDTGAGLHQIGFNTDGSIVAISNSSADTVSLIDTNKLTKLGDIHVGKTPLKAVWVNKAERFYVAGVNDSNLFVLDPHKLTVESKLETGRGTVEIAADPDGRFLWLVNALESKAYVIDTASNQKAAFVNLSAEPDQIVFTEGYAYFRSLGSEKFTLVNRKQLTNLSFSDKLPSNQLTELSATQIQAGEKPPAFLPEAIGAAAMMASIPEQNGIMIANAPAKTIYYYTEGMMVPMGTLDNYQRVPKAIMILDRSLQETGPGVFSAPVNIEKSGNYDVAVVLDQPRISHCFSTRLAGKNLAYNKMQDTKTPVMIEFIPLAKPPSANNSITLDFKLHNGKSKQLLSGVKDARLLAFEPPGLWQKRQWLEEVEKGVYRAVLTFPHAGNFNLLVEAPSQGLAFTEQKLTTIKIAGTQHAPQP